MNPKITSLLAQKEIGICWTDKPVTPWGGLTLFSGVAQQVGLVSALREALPFRLTSPNATDPVEVVLAFMAGVLAGSRRLAHIERLRWDEGLKKIFGIERFVSDTTLSRFFRRFGAAQVHEVFERLMRWQHRLIPLSGQVLDAGNSAFQALCGWSDPGNTGTKNGSADVVVGALAGAISGLLTGCLSVAKIQVRCSWDWIKKARKQEALSNPKYPQKPGTKKCGRLRRIEPLC